MFPHGTSWRIVSTVPSVPLVAMLGVQDAGVDETGPGPVPLAMADAGVARTIAAPRVAPTAIKPLTLINTLRFRLGESQSQT
jgi:hypothetical protein